MITFKNSIMNNGKILIRYMGNSTGDKNLPELDFILDAKVETNEENESCIVYEMFYPNFPFNGKIYFNINSGNAENSKMYIHTHQVIKIESNEFIIASTFYYFVDGDTENFEIIGRFQGEVPNDLCYSVCPSLNEMVS